MDASRIVIKIVLSLLYLFAGLALFWGRKRLVEDGKPPNLAIRPSPGARVRGESE